MTTQIGFKAPPTVARFMKSEAFFRLIAGPVGSGKTTGCIMELLRRSCEQRKAPDGFRYTRFAVVRQTLKQLKDTVLKDITQWLDGIVSYKVSENTIYVSFGDVRSEWLLIPLDDPEDQRRLLSMQLTGAWLSEAIEMNTEIIAPLMGRLGRYPSPAIGGPSWFGAIADTNMPSEGDPWYNLMEVNTPPDWDVHIQPGGLDPNAENIENLPGGVEYYNRFVRNSPADWVRRYVHAQYGSDPTGSGVFKETFKGDFHSVKLSNKDREDGREFALDPVYGYPLIVTQDFGRNPCALISQVDHRGRGLVLEEIVSEDMGLELHLQQRLMPALNKTRYTGRPVYVIGDPAGTSKSTTFEETSFDVLKRHGLRAFPAPTNKIEQRIKAVDALLLQQRDGGGAMLIDADQCPKLMQALRGRYRYSKKRNGQLHPLPEKLHPWSDLADCLQYFALVVQGGFHQYVANRITPTGPRVLSAGPRPRISSGAWT